MSITIWTINGYPLYYILFNIFLGLIPFFLFQVLFRLSAVKNKIKTPVEYLLFFLWLIFMPNTIYILTDIRHINGFCTNTLIDICGNAWMIIFFFVYGIIGWVLYFYAMEQMILFLQQRLMTKINIFLPWLIIPIVSLGLLLGLMDRLNSWDVLIRPSLVVLTIWSYFNDWGKLSNFFIFTLGLLFLYYFAKFIFKSSKKLKILN